jgi:hypothetical protein
MYVPRNEHYFTLGPAGVLATWTRDRTYSGNYAGRPISFGLIAAIARPDKRQWPRFLIKSGMRRFRALVAVPRERSPPPHSSLNSKYHQPYTEAFRNLLVREGIDVIRLPPKSPNLNAFAERFRWY